MLTILAAFGIAILCFASGYFCRAVVGKFVAQKEAQAKADVQQVAASAADAIQTVATDVTKAL